MIAFILSVWSLVGLLAFGYSYPEDPVGWTVAQQVFVLSLYGPVLWLAMTGYGIWWLLGRKPSTKNKKLSK